MILPGMYNSAKVKCVGNTYMYLYIVSHIIIRTLNYHVADKNGLAESQPVNIKEE